MHWPRFRSVVRFLGPAGGTLEPAITSTFFNQQLETGAAGAESCFHCGQPVPAGRRLTARIDGADRPMCCPGCQAVAEAIVGSGHDNFYRVRSGHTPGVEHRDTGDVAVYDLPEIQRRFVHVLADETREVSLILEGISCAACIWLIEKHLGELPGVVDLQVNYATQHALLRWNDRQTRLSEILREIEAIGYRAMPCNAELQQAAHRRERRSLLRRLAVAGLFGMQVMMLSISLYAGAWTGIEREFEQFFRWLGLCLTLPVVLYSAAPFFTAAWRDLRQRRIAMDLPVSIAIGAAFAGSLLATWRGGGEVYFDSVVMFVFFLTASRYFESVARHRSAVSIERLVQSLPMVANRLTANGDVEEAVPAVALAVGDRVLVRPGETVPADATILEGSSAIDESLLSGESMPVEKSPGERLFGGSVNRSNPLRVSVTAVGADTVIAEIQRSVERALADKPPLARLADRVAARFVGIVLATVAGVAVYWWLWQPGRWFETALAVLIVSCPCALSLATPTAISATLGRMQALGMLVKRALALETAQRITHVVFDKTGTLTRGEPLLERIECAPGCEREACLRLAAGLERHSQHPLARSLVRAAGTSGKPALRPESVSGGGLRAHIDGREYFIGSSDFIATATAAKIPRQWLDEIAHEAVSAVFLATAEMPMAMFVFSDELRAEARSVVAALRERGLEVLLMTGDRDAAAAKAARLCGIDDYRAGLAPGDKMAAVQAMQGRGARVMMIGDGINDAPVLACADVSVAMGGATALARGSADIVLMSSRLEAVTRIFEIAARTRRIVRQNLVWALVYNFGAIPAAALGLVAPWLAALGMSVSSLVVVLNASRLAR